MGWENAGFFVLASATLVLSLLRFGWNSFVSLGILGAFLYAIPAMIGAYTPIQLTLGIRGVFATPSTEAVAVLAVAWVTLAVLVAILPRPAFQRAAKAATMSDGAALRACALLVMAGYAYIASTLGPFYFLAERSETELGLASTLWRWTFVFGLILSVQEKRPVYGAFFLLFLTVHMIAGDRTIPAIAVAAAVLTAFIHQGRRRALPRPATLGALTILFAVLLVAKPLYFFIKTPSAEMAALLLNPDALRYAALGFEPLGTFSLLQVSIDEGVRIPFDLFFASIFGNLLVFPSLFGVDTNLFNTTVTGHLPSDLSFGVAGNYFAHGFVTLGVPGVTLFAALFALALHGLERAGLRATGVFRAFCVISAAIIAIYAHRNGLDNLLSFLRQVAVVGLSIAAIAALDRALLPRRAGTGRQSA